MVRGCSAGGGFNLREHVGKRFLAGQVDVELGAARAAKVRMRVVESGEEVDVSSGSGEVVHMRLRTCQP
jgi:hypothetical protein